MKEADYGLTEMERLQLENHIMREALTIVMAKLHIQKHKEFKTCASCDVQSFDIEGFLGRVMASYYTNEEEE